MNNLKKKIIAIVTGLTLVVMMAPGLALGGTAEDIAALQATIAALQTQLNAAAAQLATLQGVAPAVTGCTITSFDRNLKQGMTGDDVKCLQIILNSDAATQVAATGVGSSGNETSYFGALTKAAVVKFQEKYAPEVLASYGLTAGTGFVGLTTRAKLNSLLAVVTPPAGVVCGNGTCETGETTANCLADCPVVIPAAAGLTAALASNTPASGTIATTSGTTDLGSSVVELVKFTFTNGDTSDVKVTNLKIKRIGISDDTTLPAIYLFDGYTRLGDESTLSSSVVAFNNSAGIFTVPAGSSKTISVRADIKTATSGQTIGMELVAATDVTTDASAVNGTFPITGNLMSIAQASTPAQAYLSTATPVPTGDTSIDATNDYIIYQNTLTVNQQNANLEYLRFTQIGSISAGDLDNIRLSIAGTQVATGKLVAGLVGQDLIFDLSAAPIAFTKGQSKQITVYADIVGGATKTLRIGLEKSADILLKDAAYGNYVMVGSTGATTAFTANRTGTKTIAQGTVTVTRRTDSPSTAVVLNASNVSLAKFDVKANGEEIKINSLKVRIDVTDDDSGETIKYLRNCSLLLDGVQVGNTTTVAVDYAESGLTINVSDYTSFNIYQKIPAATTKVLEVKADVYGCSDTNCSSNILESNDTVQVEIYGAASLANAQGMASLAMIDAPAATAEATTLDVGVGGLTLKINTAYGAQSTAPGSDTRIGSFVLNSAEYDAINISSFTVAVTVTTMATTNMSNIYLKYDGTESTKKGTVSSSNVFSSTTTLEKSKSLTIDVWSTIASTVTSGTVSTTLDISATKVTDGSSVTIAGTPVSGQTITVAAANLSTKKASDSPVSAIVVGQDAGVLMGKFTLSAIYEAFTVSRAKITVDSGTDDDFFSLYLTYKDAAGTTVTSSALPLTTGVADFTGLTMYVANASDANLSVYANLNAVATSGYADSGDQPRVALTYYKASSGSNPSWIGINAAGEDENLGANGKQANPMLLYKTEPTVALKGAATGTLTNAPALYAVTIGASAKGDVDLKKITFDVSTSLTSGDTLNTFKFYRGSVDLTDDVAIENASGSLEGTTYTIDNSEANMEVTVTVDSDTPEVITKDTSQTYYLKATLTGTVAVGDNVMTFIKDDADATSSTPATYATVEALTTTYDNFIWSDNTYPSALHSLTSADWTNGYLVDTLSTDTYTLSK